MSSAYLPQTDGQTEILNRYLEDYLRCFTDDHPRHWQRLLPWAEYHYNTAWHSSIQMTPFEGIFGQAPPAILDYMSGSSSVDAVDTLLQDRTHTLSTLNANLLRAQHRMKTQADAKRTDISFHEDDWVFLKLQPYRQRSLTGHSTHKLSKRFFGPFKILQKIGPVAYRLALPNTAQLHDVFHVSKLKRCVGDPSIQQLPLPSEFQNDRPVAQPAEIINSRFIIRQGQHLR